jgi:hypothetical protein
MILAKINIVTSKSMQNGAPKIEGTFDGSSSLCALNERQRSILLSVPPSHETKRLLKCADAIDTLLTKEMGRSVDDHGGIVILDGDTVVLRIENTANPNATYIQIEISDIVENDRSFLSRARERCSQRRPVGALGSLLLICSSLLNNRRML